MLWTRRCFIAKGFIVKVGAKAKYIKNIHQFFVFSMLN